MSRRRPSAFEVSFPEEANKLASTTAGVGEMLPPLTNTYLASSRSSSVASSATTSSLGKRKADGVTEVGRQKRRQLPKAERYRRPDKFKEIRESNELVVQGEDPDDDEDDQKPIRLLDEFAIFDPKHGFEMVTLDTLEQDDGVDRQFEAAGRVSAYYDNDEDEGQEDSDIEEAKPLYVNLSAILRFSVNYAVDAEPFYIETQYAWYILRSPSQKYKEHWVHFCTPHRIAQIVISRALERPKEDFPSFLQRFESKTLMGRTFVKSDLWENIVDIQDTILEEDDSSKIITVPFVKHILLQAPARPKTPRSGRAKRVQPKAPAKISLSRDIDLAVLKPENQNPTCVTPRIAKLAEGYFREEIMVVGSAPPPVDKAALKRKQKTARKRLWALIEKTRTKKRVSSNKANRVSIEYDIYTEVAIDSNSYKVGDVVLVPGEEEMPSTESQLPENATIYDYFWFAKVQFFVVANQTAHIQWFNHGSKTFLGELANPQELFLAEHCDIIALNDIITKVNVHFVPDILPPDKPDDFFCKFMHSLGVGAFTSIDKARLELFSSQTPPDNCPVCPMLHQREFDTKTRPCKDEAGNLNGVAFGGTNYHYEDFVLYRAQKGPANVGYITGLTLGIKEPKVTARKVGRLADLQEIMPKNMFRDERQLYLTDEKVTLNVEDLLKVIYVPCSESFQPPNHTLEDWLALSYDHFYLKYAFPKLKVKDWADRRHIGWRDLHVCTPCCKERLQKRKDLYRFLDMQKRKPLNTLDLFGGVGAFSRGLSGGSGCLKVTHAIEISPSAAKTFARNSPETLVSNQCANEMLRYVIKSQQGHQVDVPKQKYDDKTPVPPQPKPGEIDVITAGFPCQSHSGMNMFKNTEDTKSNLILTTLSFMDYYSPLYAYFENVPGFIRFALNAKQVDMYTTSGGISSGGLKLVCRALLDMGYQFHVCQLQAAQYGTPQRRVRFFIIAAKEGQVLPDLPEPTHDFPENKTLKIKIKVGNSQSHHLSPVRFADGIAQHPFVNVSDAIFDLPRFDWKHPNPTREPTDRRKERREREILIPSFECNKGDNPYCGLRGEIGYSYEPETRYQLAARIDPTRDIQQYTRRFDARKIERVLNIPFRVDADYRDLPNGMLEWQFVDPSSSVGRKKYRPGLYGRVDENSIFQTTVTNIDPTAKQCRVLHPRDHRILTVRELARSQGFPDSFVFESIGNNVVTMHRQIGNAVPLPMGHALGRELRESLFKKWTLIRENATLVESDDEDDANGQNQYHHLGIVDDDDDDAMDIY